ncbi:hypothetical protein [uncultured Acinetobacter sp.]|uniref:hypothetical protein n=1 Tax=uncultured Acinetobacter sp. TaxID=165433 RepID=UPI00258BE229|nr:hypothetical protein [uncultured Acinetobacter sp.]
MERPILFNTTMVQAILEGSKTQTRRIVKSRIVIEQAEFELGNRPAVLHSEPSLQHYVDNDCPYGQVGDFLWVRETFRLFDSDECPHSDFPCGCPSWGTPLYRASHDCFDGEKWTPSIHMPRSASRILLEIIHVRIERLNDISSEDAKAEGVEQFIVQDNVPDGDSWVRADRLMWKGYKNKERAYRETAIESFKSLWQEINGSDSWAANPWVWVVEFKVKEPQQ